MLLKVAKDDVESYRNNNNWLENHPNQSKFFGEIEEIWLQLENTYTQEFKKLVYGKLPQSNEVFNSLKRVRNRMEQITWEITI
jgi:hypothetical protein